MQFFIFAGTLFLHVHRHYNALKETFFPFLDNGVFSFNGVISNFCGILNCCLVFISTWWMDNFFVKWVYIKIYGNWKQVHLVFRYNKFVRAIYVFFRRIAQFNFKLAVTFYFPAVLNYCKYVGSHIWKQVFTR